MKNSKSRNDNNRQRLDDYDQLDRPLSKKKFQPKRRPVRNWTKAWIEHENEEDLDEFYGK